MRRMRLSRIRLCGAIFAVILSLGGCTTIVTAPVELTGAVISTSFDIIGSAGGAIVNTVTGGESDDEEAKEEKEE